MATILERVNARRDLIKADPKEAARTGTLAIAAIHAGVGTPAWEAYMAQFGEITPLDPEQIKRLNATDGSLGTPELDKRRAYLVSNGVCGIASPLTGGLPDKVDSIDNGVGGAVCP